MDIRIWLKWQQREDFLFSFFYSSRFLESRDESKWQSPKANYNLDQLATAQRVVLWTAVILLGALQQNIMDKTVPKADYNLLDTSRLKKEKKKILHLSLEQWNLIMT